MQSKGLLMQKNTEDDAYYAQGIVIICIKYCTFAPVFHNSES